MAANPQPKELDLVELVWRDGEFVNTRTGTVVSPPPKAIGETVLMYQYGDWPDHDVWDFYIGQAINGLGLKGQVNAYTLNFCAQNRNSAAAQLFYITEKPQPTGNPDHATD